MNLYELHDVLNLSYCLVRISDVKTTIGSEISIVDWTLAINEFWMDGCMIFCGFN